MFDTCQVGGQTRRVATTQTDTRSRILDTAWALIRRHGTNQVRVADIRKLPPVEGLEALLRLWFAYIPEILPFASALEAAAASGEEGGAAWHDRMGDLWEAFRIAVDRVHRDGRLADGWTVRTATDWISARSHLTTWQYLVGERDWHPADYTERAVRSILA